MLSLQEFELEDEEVLGEEDDMVRPLSPLRISSNGTAASAISPTVSSLAEEIVTPISDKSSNEKDLRFAGSSPPRRAPIGTGAGASLERKESKWRKSINVVTEAALQLPRRTSYKPAAPPSSYDPNAAQQRGLAANRRSCAPTMHSAASVAAELREIRNKEEADTAESFFLS